MPYREPARYNPLRVRPSFHLSSSSSTSASTWSTTTSTMTTTTSSGGQQHHHPHSIYQQHQGSPYGHLIHQGVLRTPSPSPSLPPYSSASSSMSEASSSARGASSGEDAASYVTGRRRHGVTSTTAPTASKLTHLSSVNVSVFSCSPTIRISSSAQLLHLLFIWSFTFDCLDHRRPWD